MSFTGDGTRRPTPVALTWMRIRGAGALPWTHGPATPESNRITLRLPGTGHRIPGNVPRDHTAQIRIHAGPSVALLIYPRGRQNGRTTGRKSRPIRGEEASVPHPHPNSPNNPNSPHNPHILRRTHRRSPPMPAKTC